MTIICNVTMSHDATLALQSPTPAAIKLPSLLKTQLRTVNIDPELLPDDDVREGPRDHDRSNPPVGDWRVAVTGNVHIQRPERL